MVEGLLWLRDGVWWVAGKSDIWALEKQRRSWTGCSSGQVLGDDEDRLGTARGRKREAVEEVRAGGLKVSGGTRCRRQQDQKRRSLNGWRLHDGFRPECQVVRRDGGRAERRRRRREGR